MYNFFVYNYSLLFASIICFFIISIIFYAIANKVKYIKANNNRSTMINNILLNAIDNRIIIDTYIGNTNNKSYIGKSFIVNAVERKFTINISRQCTFNITKDDIINMYFSVRHLDTFIKYNCLAKALRSWVHAGNMHVECEAIEIGNNQRRRFFRFSPCAEQLSIVGSWAFESLLPVQGEAAPAGTAGTRKKWTTIRSENIRLSDISAGGALLVVDDEGTFADLQTPSHLVLSLSLTEAGKAPTAFFFMGEVVRMHRPDASGKTTPKEEPAPVSQKLGIRWRRWAQKLAQPKLVWHDVEEDDGVQPLATWIHRHQALKTRLTCPKNGEHPAISDLQQFHGASRVRSA